MDKLTAAAICQERLARWVADLASETATPMLLVGIKQGENMGELVLCVTEDLETNAIRAFLMAALRELPSNGSHA